MANFGLSELALVDPHIPAWRETAVTSGSGEPASLRERTRAAVGAADIVKSARVFSALAKAASDCRILLGTSALQRRKPERDVISLAAARVFMAERLPAKNGRIKVGVLFGSEKSGLTNEDLSHCHAVLNIPTCEKQPSINLGQAVALVCYELAGRACIKTPRAARKAAPLPSVHETEQLLSEICALMDEGRGPGRVEREHETEIRRGLLDARLTKGAMGVLKTLLRRARI
jgi:tRNA/rRNA methyltransferase